MPIIFPQAVNYRLSPHALNLCGLAVVWAGLCLDAPSLSRRNVSGGLASPNTSPSTGSLRETWILEGESPMLNVVKFVDSQTCDRIGSASLQQLGKAEFPHTPRA